MSIKTTTPVADAAELGGQLPGYYAKASRGFGRMELTGPVAASVDAYVQVPFQGKYTDREGGIVHDGYTFKVTESGLYLVNFNLSCTTKISAGIRIRCSDGKSAGTVLGGFAVSCSMLNVLEANTSIFFEAYTTAAGTYAASGATYATIARL